jgi:hypothetical protein
MIAVLLHNSLEVILGRLLFMRFADSGLMSMIRGITFLYSENAISCKKKSQDKKL